MTVHRTKPLRVGSANGHLVVTTAVIEQTAMSFSQSGNLNPPHEGLVLWLGHQTDGDTIVMDCYQPRVRSGPSFVFADEVAIGEAARVARRRGHGVIAQVHSHPGTDTRHSDGDDDLVVMPFNGMFSLVIAEYGRGSFLPELGAGLHQRQGHEWILVPPLEKTLVLVPQLKP